MTKDTTNKNSRSGIIITAGASGIGRCMAETFLSEGYAVHICDIDQSNIDDFLVSNPQATASFADVSQPQQVALLFATIVEFSRMRMGIGLQSETRPIQPAR